ncbi:MAG: hypothetical protein JRH07_15910 [Deltaproteobacteria bacterium]|nr:hypothetical protein [Deltaproteobacteria bacterium]MBW2123309.1 hypothetical protein [Deltaproteobacteria bacterium]
MKTNPGVRVCKVGGSPFERGVQYGTACSDLIQRNLEIYRSWFVQVGGVDENRLSSFVRAATQSIHDYDPDIAEEIRGIAQGSGTSLEDIVALNSRTEIGYALRGECTAVGLDPVRSDTGNVLLAQNWDWLPSLAEGTVLLEVEQPGRPTVLTLTEAGLVAKIGINSQGIGLAVNLLDCGYGGKGVPFHVLCRGVLNSRCLSDSLVAILRSACAGSSNLMIASAQGELIDIELVPDGFCEILPHEGLLLHTNHFLTHVGPKDDRFKRLYPDTITRLARARFLLSQQARISIEGLWSVLSDHVNYPDSICCHPNPGQDEMHQSRTNASIIMDFAGRELHLRAGPPCSRPTEILEFPEEK